MHVRNMNLLDLIKSLNLKEENGFLPIVVNDRFGKEILSRKYYDDEEKMMEKHIPTFNSTCKASFTLKVENKGRMNEEKTFSHRVT